jgi:hypothetical protein
MNNHAPQTPDAVVQSVIGKVNGLPENDFGSLDCEALEDMQMIVLGFAKLLIETLPNTNDSETIKTMLNERSLVGIEKYGTTLQEAKLSKEQVLQHAVEELLDCANYLEKLLAILQNPQTNE